MHLSPAVVTLGAGLLVCDTTGLACVPLTTGRLVGDVDTGFNSRVVTVGDVCCTGTAGVGAGAGIDCIRICNRSNASKNDNDGVTRNGQL